VEKGNRQKQTLISIGHLKENRTAIRSHLNDAVRKRTALDCESKRPCNDIGSRQMSSNLSCKVERKERIAVKEEQYLPAGLLGTQVHLTSSPSIRFYYPGPPGAGLANRVVCTATVDDNDFFNPL